MPIRLPSLLFLALLAVLAAFVWRTSAELPPVVATHFILTGQANGFMPRKVYRWVALAVVTAPPLLVAYLPVVLLRRGSNRINLPHRDYWLAPERREATLAFLRLHGLLFAAGVAVFLAFVHAQVAQANLRHPPVMDVDATGTGTIVLLAGLMVWLFALHARFRRPR